MNCNFLPIDCNKWDKLEKWGVIKGEEVDSLSVSCVLPEGWSLRPTEDTYWRELVDDRGLKRASVFYKFAFYDCRAFTCVVDKRYCATDNHKVKDGLAYEVRDNATNTTVKQYPTGYWGFITTSTGIRVVGLIYEGQFHYYAVEQEGKCYFTKTCPSDLATQIDKDTFYREFHHVKSEFEAIEAARSLLKQTSIVDANRMNEESDW